jgi:hypothetical protein
MAPVCCAAVWAMNFRRVFTATCRQRPRRRLKRLHQSFKADAAYAPSSSLGLKSGTALTRTWRGMMHHVDVVEGGFEYRGERFGSLSEIARRITGTRWSGPLFFGLKDVNP